MPEHSSNSYFVARPSVLLGRDAVLSTLEKRLADERVCVLGTDPSLTDGAGVGRTALMEELIQRMVHAPTKLLRLRGANLAEWHHSVWRVSCELGLAESHCRKHADRIAAIRYWLSQHTDWFLVVESLADGEGLSELTQGITHGRSLVTPLNRRTEMPATWPAAVPLGGLAMEDALRLLRTAMGRDWLDDDEFQASQSLLEMLERVPRTIRWAGAAMRLGELRAEAISELLSLQSDGTPARRCQHLLLSLVESRDAEALSLLATATVLDAHTIPGPLLRSLNASGSAADRDRRWSLLVRAELLLHDTERNLVQVPASQDLRELIPAKVLKRATAQSRAALPCRLLRTRLTEIVCGATEPSIDPWAHHRIALGEMSVRFNRLDGDDLETIHQAADAALDLHLVGVAQRLLLKALDQQLHAATSEAALCQPLVELGVSYLLGEQFQLARRRLRQAIEIGAGQEPLVTELQLAVAEIDVNENRLDRATLRLMPLDPDHRSLNLPPLNPLHLGRLRWLQGGVALGSEQVVLARQRFEEALALRSAHLPVDHPDMMRTRLMMARAEFMLRNHAASEALLRAEVELREASPHVSLSDTGVALNFLGELYYLLGRLPDAEPIYEKSLAIRRQLLPREHRLIGEMADRLAVIKSSRGSFRESDTLFRESLSILEQTYGGDHPEVARVLTDLAESLFAQQKVDPARRLLERALGVQERALRSNDPRLGRTRCNLAAVYVARGRYPDAIRLYERDIAEKNAAKRPDPAALATSINNLAEALRAVGRYDEAEQQLLKALDLREQTVGPEHPQTAQILGNLGYLNFQRHRYEQAKSYLERTLRIRRATLGDRNPQLATSLIAMGETLFVSGQYLAARPLFQEGIDIFQSVYGERHPHFVSAQISSARNELRLGHVGRCELMLLRAKSLLEELLGADHRLSGKSLLAIAELAHHEKRYTDAFPLLERCLTIQNATTSSVRLDVAETLRAITENLMARQLHREALPRIIEAVEIQRSLLGPIHPEIIPNLLLIGQIQQHLGQFAAAEEAFLAVGQSTEEHLAPCRLQAIERLIDVQVALQKYDAAAAHLTSQLETVRTRNDLPAELALTCHLASVHYLRSAPQEALPLMERCVALSEQMHGPQHVETAKHLDNLAGVHFLLSDLAAAEVSVQRSIAIFEANASSTSANSLAKARENYAQLLRHTNRLDEAASIEKQMSATVVDPSAQQQFAESHVLDDLF